MRISNRELMQVLDKILERRYEPVCNQGITEFPLDSTEDIEAFLRYIVGQQNGNFVYACSNFYDELIKKGNWFTNENGSVDLNLFKDQVDIETERKCVFKTTFFCTLILLYSARNYPQVTRLIYNLSSQSIRGGLVFIRHYIGGNHVDPDIARYFRLLLELLKEYYNEDRILSSSFARSGSAGQKQLGIFSEIERLIAEVYYYGSSGNDDSSQHAMIIIDSYNEFEDVIETAVQRQDKVLQKRLKDTNPENYVKHEFQEEL